MYQYVFWWNLSTHALHKHVFLCGMHNNLACDHVCCLLFRKYNVYAMLLVSVQKKSEDTENKKTCNIYICDHIFVLWFELTCWQHFFRTCTLLSKPNMRMCLYRINHVPIVVSHEIVSTKNIVSFWDGTIMLFCVRSTNWCIKHAVIYTCGLDFLYLTDVALWYINEMYVRFDLYI